MTGSLDHSISPDHELLVAYLDGELTPDEAQRVEGRLGRDEAFRKMLRDLQETWDLLDDLPQPTLDDGFTRTTVEMVAVKLDEMTQADAKKLQRHSRLRNLTTGALMAACLLLGFWGARYWQNRHDRELLRDLSVIENVDVYTELDDIAFLERLAEAGVFSEAIDEESSDELP